MQLGNFDAGIRTANSTHGLLFHVANTRIAVGGPEQASQTVKNLQRR